MKNYAEDERIISAFLHNYRMMDIVRETGLSKNTCYKIRNDPKFQKVLRERKEAILKTAVAKMQGYIIRDTEILQEIIEDEANSPQVRVNAIQALFNQLRELTTTSDIMTRLEALQRAFEDGNGTF